MTLCVHSRRLVALPHGHVCLILALAPDLLVQVVPLAQSVQELPLKTIELGKEQLLAACLAGVLFGGDELPQFEFGAVDELFMAFAVCIAKLFVDVGLNQHFHK